MIRVTADLHIGDSYLARRGFGSAGEMAEYVLGIWNRDVGAEDDVYVIGDFVMDGWESYVERMVGRIHLIRGNHDTESAMHALWERGVEILGHVHELNMQERVILVHKPTAQVAGSDGAVPIMLHGHGHSNRATDVGIWSWDKIPTLEEAVAYAKGAVS